MPPDNQDAARLLDMLMSARLAMEYVRDVTFDQYLANNLIRDAVERRLAIIGEAARKVSQRFKELHPEIPWQPITSQRHVLVHDYESIDSTRIWKVLTVHLPVLVPLIEKLIPDAPQERP